MDQRIDQDSRDRPALCIPPNAIDEGVRVYLEHCPDSGVGDRLDRKMIVEIFEAMMAAMPSVISHR